MRPEEDHAFQCAYCGAEVMVRLDTTGGRSQVFTHDCDVCCRPMVIRVQMDTEGIAGFSVEPEA